MRVVLDTIPPTKADMANTRKIRGRFSDPRYLELDEPVHDLTGPVEVLVRPAALPAPSAPSTRLIGLCADLGRAPSAVEIDQARREMWAGFPRDDV